MDFIDELRNFSSRALKVKEVVTTEDATKMSLVVPFFKLLGYDVYNPLEFVPEFTADVGVKKGEKVDFAIVIDDNPIILIECKKYGEPLDKHASQLFRYFGTTTAKFGILTDVGRLYTRPASKYVAVLLDDNRNKRIGRLWLKSSKRYITIPDENKKPIRYDISKVDDIYDYADLIKESCERYLNNINELVEDTEE